ncbi:nucleolin-like [Lytechinus variegatus]|uniref:nucleolin-like n=1 Tax=Lytechinus variegatus TaxID=7654 RepID=UPI001BB28996|nr:nucleolin-like [Lytechinus variegatus]
MAEKAVEQNLSCPLCFEIFDEPTILTSCGHTFCRKCLKNYDKSQSRKEPDRNYMVCPICRGITEFKSTNRVDDFCPNLLVKGLVDDVKDVLEKKNLKSNERPSRRPAETQNPSSSTRNDPNATSSSTLRRGAVKMIVFDDGTMIKTMPDGSKIKVMPDGRKFKMKRLTSSTARTADARSSSSRLNSGSPVPPDPSSNASRQDECLHQPSTSGTSVGEPEQRALQNNTRDSSRRPAETRSTSSSKYINPNAMPSSKSNVRAIEVILLSDGTMIKTMPDGSKIKIIPDGRKFKMKRLTSSLAPMQNNGSHSSQLSNPAPTSLNSSRPDEHLQNPSSSDTISNYSSSESYFEETSPFESEEEDTWNEEEGSEDDDSFDNWFDESSNTEHLEYSPSSYDEVDSDEDEDDNDEDDEEEDDNVEDELDSDEMDSDNDEDDNDPLLERQGFSKKLKYGEPVQKNPGQKRKYEESEEVYSSGEDY